jgi:hypothetical protein
MKKPAKPRAPYRVIAIAPIGYRLFSFVDLFKVKVKNCDMI